MLGAGDAAVSLNRHQAAGLSPVTMVGKSEAGTATTPASVNRAAAARRQVLVRLLTFITFVLFGSSFVLFYGDCAMGMCCEVYGQRSIFATSADQQSGSCFNK